MSNDMAASNPSSSSAGMGLEAASQKKYLKWYNKVGYGSGDVAGNVVYALLSAFVMIYLAVYGRTEPGCRRHVHDVVESVRRYLRHDLRYPAGPHEYTHG